MPFHLQSSHLPKCPTVPIPSSRAHSHFTPFFFPCKFSGIRRVQCQSIVRLLLIFIDINLLFPLFVFLILRTPDNDESTSFLTVSPFQSPQVPIPPHDARWPKLRVSFLVRKPHDAPSPNQLLRRAPHHHWTLLPFWSKSSNIERV